MKSKPTSLRRLDLLASKWRKQSHSHMVGAAVAMTYAELAGELETVVAKMREKLK